MKLEILDLNAGQRVYPCFVRTNGQFVVYDAVVEEVSTENGGIAFITVNRGALGYQEDYLTPSSSAFSSRKSAQDYCDAKNDHAKILGGESHASQ